jgi:hypothetical protein
VVIDAAEEKPRRITDAERSVIENIVDAPLVFRER